MYIKNTFGKWATALTLLLLFGCQSTPTKVAPTSTGQIILTQHNPTQTATLANPKNPTMDSKNAESLNDLDFTDLKQGQYLLAQSYEQGISNLYVYSIEGQIVKKIIFDANFSVSNDGTQLLIVKSSSTIYYSLNLQTQETTSFKLDSDCYDANLSPDKQFMALSCSNDWTGDIYIFGKNSNSMSRLTDCLEKSHSCFKPSWSPDGKWLAYYRNEEKSGIHTLDGIYLLNMACKETDCDKQIGPIQSDSNPAWLQNNELVTSELGSINYFEISSNSLIPTGRSEVGIENIISLYLSPDGEHIAFSPIDSSAIYIFSNTSGATKKLIEFNQEVILIGWIMK